MQKHISNFYFPILIISNFPITSYQIFSLKLVFLLNKSNDKIEKLNIFYSKKYLYM